MRTKPLSTDAHKTLIHKRALLARTRKDNTIRTIPGTNGISGMGWLRLVGSIKLQVSFAEYCLFFRALLQKRPMILSILLTKATTYENGRPGTQKNPPGKNVLSDTQRTLYYRCFSAKEPCSQAKSTPCTNFIHIHPIHMRWLRLAGSLK